jgi:hypothetical protein
MPGPGSRAVRRAKNNIADLLSQCNRIPGTPGGGQIRDEDCEKRELNSP